MIIGRHEKKNLTYFTPMNRIFEHIMKVTGASSIRMARFEEVSNHQGRWLKPVRFSNVYSNVESHRGRDSGIAISSLRSSFMTTESADEGVDLNCI